jgi:hypothetical protein
MTRRRKVLLALSSTVVAVLVCEAALRLLSGVPVFTAVNFRNAQVVQATLSGAGRFDDVLGWAMRDHYRSPILNTIEHGIRKNSPSSEALRDAAILVIGSSFTAGSEVNDHETWPAQLEGLTGERTLNAAVGGYSVDQIVLRAEQLLPVLRPRALIVEVMDGSIQWSSYSVRSRPKPYFTVEQGRLIAHNSPVPPLVTGAVRFEGLKTAAGHLLLIDRLMASLAPDAWYASPTNVVTRIQSDEVEVSCRLLGRLKETTDAVHVRMILLTHVAGREFDASAPPGSLALVEECSRAMGLQVAATFPAFKEAQRRAPDDFTRFFVMRSDGVMGHMSPEGNHLIATVAAEALRAAPPAPKPGGVLAADTFVPGDGQNLVTQSEALHVMFSGSVAEIRPIEPPTSPREFRITATGPKGEHYIGASLTGLTPGPYTLSFEVAPSRTPMMRAQVLDAFSGGVIGDIDFSKQTTSTIRYGRTQRLSAGLKALGGGWHRAWVSGRLASAPTTILLQLSDGTGALDFTPGPETLTVRRLQVERGESPSPYRPTVLAAAGSGEPDGALRADGALDGPLVSGDGHNVVPDAEALEQWIPATAHASFRAASTATPREFEIQARGAAGEHYVASQPLSLPRSAYTLGFDVRPNGLPTMRVQLQETSGATGLLTDIDFASMTARTTRRGQARVRPATVVSLAQGWYRVTITTDLGADTMQVLFQLADRKGAHAFTPAGEAVSIRALMIEAGQTASAYGTAATVGKR